MPVYSLLRCGRRRVKLPRHGSLCHNWFRMGSSSVWHSTSQPFRGLKGRHHGLGGAKTQATRQSFFVSTFRRLHSLDQLCNSVVYQCAKFRFEILRMKETSSCGFWGERPCHVRQLWLSVTCALLASDMCGMLPTVSESVYGYNSHPSRRSHSSWPRESAQQKFYAFDWKFH